MSNIRQKAIAMNAADAKLLLNSSLPFVFKQMTPAQVAQVQKVLDAAVVNPEIKRRADEMYRKSVRAQAGDLVMRDEKIVDQAYRLANSAVHITENDYRIRLDHKTIVTPDAFLPRTDNPDETAYLARVRAALADKGVWLRINQPLVRVPGEAGKWTKDPRKFEVWLSLGANGDAIPTKDGRLDREALLATTAIGAGYYTNVHRGDAQKTLEREISRLRHEIDAGLSEHDRLIKRKRDAFIGVAEISDLLGGADLPDRSIWDHAHKLVLQAAKLNVGGNLSASQAYLVVAAIVTRNCAKLVAEYADKSSRGAARAITALRVMKTAGEIAEIGLTVTGVGAVVRGGARAAGSKASQDAVDKAAEKLVNEIVRKDPSIAADLNKVKWVPGPKGTVLGRGVKPGQSAGHGTGWHKW